MSAPEPVPPPLREEAKRLAALVERLEPARREARLLRARAAVDLLADPETAVRLASAATEGDDAEPWRILARAHAKQHATAALAQDIIHLMEASAFDLALVQPLVANLETDKEGEKVLRHLRPFAVSGALGFRSFDDLERHAGHRKRVRALLAFLSDEHDFAWGASRERVTVAPLARDELAHAVDSLRELLDETWREPDLHAQLLWTRGIVREKLAQDQGGLAHALLDLADGARALHEKALPFLARVEAAVADSRATGLDAAIDRGEQDDSDELWNRWEDALLLRAAIAAARIKRDGGADREALERCDEVLDSDPESALAHVVRSFLLARDGRTAEAEEDLAAALAISPELEHPEEIGALTWIEKTLDGAKQRAKGR